MVVDQLGVPGAGVLQVKQIRHWSLTRTLYWPARLPDSFSSRLPGGTRKSLMLSAALMRTSLLYASLLSSGLSFFTNRRCQIASVSLSRNERITHQ